MGKNIVICCDGTGNSFENPSEESNVVKLYSALTLDARQMGYYHPGVGTMGDPRARYWISRQVSKVSGLAVGAGLLENVGDAYRYLMNTYADGDHIFLFGFSRGAYTARAVASVLHVYGLLCAGNDGLIPYVLKEYAAETKRSSRNHSTFSTDDLFRWQFSHTQFVKVHFCGLWDTVSSYGWAYDPINLPFSGQNPIIEIGRHAVAINERRCYYRDNLWGPALPGQNMKQAWFAGSHSDIGGSYPEQESGLAKIALEWMLAEAHCAGLLIDPQKAATVLGRGLPSPPIAGMPAYVQPDANAQMHDSLSGTWWLAEYLPQRYQDDHGRWSVPRGRQRTIPQNALIHESTLKGSHRPAALPPHTVEPWVTYPPPESS
jgi:uncharacterized protein (DUF2235 family)